MKYDKILIDRHQSQQYSSAYLKIDYVISPSGVVMDANAFCRSLTPQYATVGGVRTHYVECGQGPTIVLLHGLSASLWNWWRNLPALAEHFHVVAFDLKGCGNSAKPRGHYTAEACVNQLTGLLDHLGIQQAALVGHSMGTRVALTTALHHPERVRALVLTSPPFYPQTARRALNLLILPGVGELYTQWLFTGEIDALVQRALRACMHPAATITPDEIYWNKVAGAQHKRRLAQTYLRYGRHMRFHKPWPLVERCHEIKQPTLIISGDTDRLVPVAYCQRLAQELPGARLEIWPTTGHLPHAEDAQRYNRTVSTFLRAQLQPPRRIPWAWLSRFSRRDTLLAS